MKGNILCGSPSQSRLKSTSCVSDVVQGTGPNMEEGRMGPRAVVSGMSEAACVPDF